MNGTKHIAQVGIEKLGFYLFDFLSESNIQALGELYYACYGNDPSNGMVVSHNHGDAAFNISVSHKINAILGKSIESQFPDYRFFLSHFAVKKAGNENSFELHQDWSIVDESQFNSYQIWIPLKLSYPENGGMCFIPRSQHFNTNIRSGSFGIPAIPITSAVYPYLSYARIFPGQAVAFSNNLLHGSFSNPTDEDRISVIVNIVPKMADTTYFHFNNNTRQTEVYSIDAETLLTHLPRLEKGEMPLNYAPKAIIDAPKQNNKAISFSDVLDWIKTDRHELGLKDNYEFKQFDIIKDPILEKQINDQGYSVVDFLSTSALNILREKINYFFEDRTIYSGRYNSMDNLSVEKRKEAHEFIVSVITPLLAGLFKDYYCPISVFYSKRNDGVNDTGWHTDPFFVFNQHLEPFYSVWCPLYDIGEENGVLNVVPYSHRFTNKLVNPNFKWALEEQRSFFNDHKLSFELKAGQSILFDSRLVHGSPPNISAMQRDCIVLRVAHKDARFMSISPTEKNTDIFNVHSQSKDFFFGNAVSKHHEFPNTGTLIGTIKIFESTEHML